MGLACLRLLAISVLIVHMLEGRLRLRRVRGRVGSRLGARLKAEREA